MAIEVYRVWFQKGAALRPGEKMYLQAESRNEQLDIMRALSKERTKLSHVNPELAMQIDITKTDREGKLWVLMTKRETSRVVGYTVMAGETTKVTLQTDEEKLRRISLMIKDGMGVKEIEAIEGTLSEEEINAFSLQREPQ